MTSTHGASPAAQSPAAFATRPLSSALGGGG